MRLEHEFTYTTAVAGPHVVGDGPYGTRHHYDMVDGVIAGERLTADVRDGGDWMLVGTDGVMRMDVRIRLDTHDGATLLAHYRGLADADDAFRTAIERGAATGYDDQRIRTVWHIESGDDRYAWVNRAIFVGEGRLHPNDAGNPGFEHRVYRIA